VKQWSQALGASSKTRLYLGAPAWVEAGPTAYNAAIGTSPEGIKGVASSVSGMGLGNFGGVMFWE
jgi:hypothetical protein